jgi:hypothetical protein
MTPHPKKPSGATHIKLGEHSPKETRSFGFSIQKAGTQTEKEHAAIGQNTDSVRRPGHKAPISLPKKGGKDAGIL